MSVDENFDAQKCWGYGRRLGLLGQLALLYGNTTRDLAEGFF
jgi:hypothetical protein